MRTSSILCPTKHEVSSVYYLDSVLRVIFPKSCVTGERESFGLVTQNINQALFYVESWIQHVQHLICHGGYQSICLLPFWGHSTALWQTECPAFRYLSLDVGQGCISPWEDHASHPPTFSRSPSGMTLVMGDDGGGSQPSILSTNSVGHCAKHFLCLD